MRSSSRWFCHVRPFLITKPPRMCRCGHKKKLHVWAPIVTRPAMTSNDQHAADGVFHPPRHLRRLVLLRPLWHVYASTASMCCIRHQWILQKSHMPKKVHIFFFRESLPGTSMKLSGHRLLQCVCSQKCEKSTGKVAGTLSRVLERRPYLQRNSCWTC